MKFVDLVPEKWREYYQEQANYLESGKRTEFERAEFEVMARLVTRPEMERVFRELRKQSSDNGYEERLWFDILNFWRKAQRQYKTRTEKNKSYQAIAKSAYKLVEAIHNSERDISPFKWFPDPAIGTILSRIRTELAEGHFCLLDPLLNTTKETVWDGKHPLKRKDDGFDVFPVAFSLNEFFQKMLIVRYPSISTILAAIAVDAEDKAKQALNEQVVLPSPNAKGAKKLVFIRLMANNFNSQFGMIMRRTTASIASVVLDEAITEDMVGDALRNWQPTLRKNL